MGYTLATLPLLPLARTVPRSVEPPVPTASFGYFRFRQPSYEDDGLAACAQRIEELAAGWDDVFAYFKHETEGRGPVYATKLRQILNGDSAQVAAEI